MNNPNFNWDAFFVPYQLAIGGFIIKLESIRKQYLCNGESSPIEIVTGRVKTPESIMDKARRMKVKVENIPDEIYPLVAKICTEQEAVSSAVAERNLDKIFAAFASDPLVTCNIDDARKMFDEMVENTKKYLTDYNL